MEPPTDGVTAVTAVTEHRRGVHRDLPHALHSTRDALGVPPGDRSKVESLRGPEEINPWING